MNDMEKMNRQFGVLDPCFIRGLSQESFSDLRDSGRADRMALQDSVRVILAI